MIRRPRVIESVLEEHANRHVLNQSLDLKFLEIVAGECPTDSWGECRLAKASVIHRIKSALLSQYYWTYVILMISEINAQIHD